MKSELLKTFELASKTTHERTFHFDLGEGVDLVCPRLSLNGCAAFERRMVAKPGSKGFSLSMLKNTAAMRMAECSGAVLEELRKEGAPSAFKDEADARMWATQFQANLVSKFAPYSEKLLGDFHKDDQIFAVTLALKEKYGDSETTTKGKGESKTEEEVIFDEKFIRVIFDAAPDMLDAMFLWTIGLVDIPDGTSQEDIAKGLDDLAASVGGSGNVVKPSPTKKSVTGKRSTTKNTSQ